MNRSPLRDRIKRPPLNVVVVAAAILEFPPDEAGWRTVSDATARDLTGYDQRTLEQGWQRIADLGVAEVGRAVKGSRLVRPLPHPVWAHVRLHLEQAAVLP